MSGPKRSEYWGLTACRPELHCAVCAKLTDQPAEMQRLRDWYCEGMHELVLVEMFAVPLKDLHRHCWQHGWVRRKKWNQPALQRTVERIIWERLAKSFHLNQSTRHWYSTKHCERAQTVRSERSRASGNVEERDYSWLRAFDCAALRSGRTERVATRSEEVYEASVV